MVLYVRMVDVIDGNNGDGDPIIVCADEAEKQRLIDFTNNQSDGRYMVEEDVYLRTVDEWIENEQEIEEELKALGFD